MAAPDTPSAAYRAFLRRDRLRSASVRAVQLALLIVFLGLWEIAARRHWINPLLSSYPSAVVPTLLELLRSGSLLRDTQATLFATLVGFGISFAAGIALAAALWWSELIYRTLDPFLVIANALPKIALVPIFYLWLGSKYAVYGMSVAVALFVAILVVYNGFAAVEPNRIKLAQTFGATRWQVLVKVVVPGSVPTLIAAAKMGIGLSLVGVIAGEFQSAEDGLGFLILNGSQVFKLNVVMAAICVLTGISAMLYGAVYVLEVGLRKWLDR